MDHAQIVSALKTFIARDILEDDSVDLDADTPLLKLQIIDSFSVLELLLFINNEFNIEIPLETVSLEDLENIGSIADLILSVNGRN
jgi:acyl carrier protein